MAELKKKKEELNTITAPYFLSKMTYRRKKTEKKGGFSHQKLNKDFENKLRLTKINGRIIFSFKNFSQFPYTLRC